MRVKEVVPYLKSAANIAVHVSFTKPKFRAASDPKIMGSDAYLELLLNTNVLALCPLALMHEVVTCISLVMLVITCY